MIKSAYNALKNYAREGIGSSRSAVYLSRDEDCLFAVPYSDLNEEQLTHLQHRFKAVTERSVLKLTPLHAVLEGLSFAPLLLPLPEENENSLWCGHYYDLVHRQDTVSASDDCFSLLLLRAEGMLRLNRDTASIRALIDMRVADMQRENSLIFDQITVKLFDELIGLMCYTSRA